MLLHENPGSASGVLAKTQQAIELEQTTVGTIGLKLILNRPMCTCRHMTGIGVNDPNTQLQHFMKLLENNAFLLQNWTKRHSGKQTTGTIRLSIVTKDVATENWLSVRHRFETFWSRVTRRINALAMNLRRFVNSRSCGQRTIRRRNGTKTNTSFHGVSV